MPTPEQTLQSLRSAVMRAATTHERLTVVGGNTKSFYGRSVSGRPLSALDYRGIVAYQPSELVITARAGTALSEVEAALAGHGQMLAFEPPHFGARATLGGTIACGFSGPRRPYSGSARDFVLGVTCMDGRGEVMRFGGRVMKNVAGYDVSRLMTGSLGTLGIILEVSLKTLPGPARVSTLRQETAPADAITRMNALAGKPWPLSAAAYHRGSLWLRLSGAEGAVSAAKQALGGEEDADGAGFWQRLREHELPFFAPALPLWRLSVPPTVPPLPVEGDWLIDWGGAQRWLVSSAPPERIVDAAAAAGGHATLFRGGDREGAVFAPLDAVTMRIHRNLKERFDPQHLFNIGRMYADF